MLINTLWASVVLAVAASGPTSGKSPVSPRFGDGLARPHVGKVSKKPVAPPLSEDAPGTDHGWDRPVLIPSFRSWFQRYKEGR
jgi:hypothetical protein